MKTAFFITAFFCSVASPAFGAMLTSLTMEISTETGEWTNPPGGIWSTNLADPLSQLGVRQNGVFLNTPGNGFELGEISIELVPGLNTFELFGSSFTGGSDYYGLSLFFDHNATPPDMAVYNINSSSGLFSITSAGTTVSGSANGGLFPDVAPGTSIYLAPDGSTVDMIDFTVLYDASNADLISWGDITPDGLADTYAVLTLNSTPALAEVPEPSTAFLIACGLLSLIWTRKHD